MASTADFPAGNNSLSSGDEVRGLADTCDHHKDIIASRAVHINSLLLFIL